MKKRKKNLRETDPAVDATGLKIWRVTKNVTDPRWSQEFVAKWLGVSPRMYRRWENGEYPIPTYVSKRIEEYERLTSKVQHLEQLLRPEAML